MKNPSNLLYLTCPKSKQRTSINGTNVNGQNVFRSHSKHSLDCILLRGARNFPGMLRIVSSLTKCHFVALFSHYSIKCYTIFTLTYLYQYSPTSLHQYGTYSQTGDESLFTKQSRSAPSESTCRCIKEDSQSFFPIQCLNFQPSLCVLSWRWLMCTL